MKSTPAVEKICRYCGLRLEWKLGRKKQGGGRWRVIHGEAGGQVGAERAVCSAAPPEMEYIKRGLWHMPQPTQKQVELEELWS